MCRPKRKGGNHPRPYMDSSLDAAVGKPAVCSLLGIVCLQLQLWQWGIFCLQVRASQHQQHSAPVVCCVTGDIREILLPFRFFFSSEQMNLPRVSLNIMRSKISLFWTISLLEKIFHLQSTSHKLRVSQCDFSLARISVEGWRVVFYNKYWRRKILRI